MEIAQLILQILIFFAIFYVVFIQEKVTKAKDSLFKTFKDFPDIAEKRFKWKEENIRQEAKQKVKEVRDQLEKEIDRRRKGWQQMDDKLTDIYILLYKIFFIFGSLSVLKELIEEMKNEDAKGAVMEFFKAAEELSKKTENKLPSHN